MLKASGYPIVGRLVAVLGISSVLLIVPNQSVAQQYTPFDGYPKVADQIFVYERPLFSSDTRRTEPSSQTPSEWETRRLGIVQLNPGTTVYVDRVDGQADSSFELTDTRTGAKLGTFYRINHNSKLLFSGHGAVYLYSGAPSVCLGMASRKYVLRNGGLVEIKQPVIQFDKVIETEVLGDIELFSSPDSREVLAKLPKGSRLEVLGVAGYSDYVDPLGEPHLGARGLLVKTPLGLTAWYMPAGSGGRLDIHACE